MSVAAVTLLALPAVILIGWVIMHDVDTRQLLDERVTALEIAVTKLLGKHIDGP